MKLLMITLPVLALTAAFYAPGDAGMPTGTEGTADSGGFGVDAALPASAPVVVRGPYLGTVTPSGVNIRWVTDRPAEPVVEYRGASSGRAWGTTREVAWKFGLVPLAHTARWQHSVTLDGLRPGSSYSYSIPGVNGLSAGGFVTAPDKNLPFSFVAYGDSRAATPAAMDQPDHRRVAARMAAERPDFLIDTGDLVMRGSSDSDWQLFFETSKELLASAPLYPAFGNHEAVGGSHARERWEAILDLPGRGREDRYYSFDYSNTHFVVLNTEEGIDRNNAQNIWLRQDLEKAKTSPRIENIIVSFHDPAYTCSKHNPDEDFQRHLTPLLRDAGVKLVLAGHNHLYEHLFEAGMHFLTLGGGGAPLNGENARCDFRPIMWAKAFHYAVIGVNGKKISVKVMDDNGRQIEAFEVK
ncbi:MAG: metallophosphoesterase family protein [Myxococcota bacterium]|jgi:hypothetical protein